MSLRALLRPIHIRTPSTPDIRHSHFPIQFGQALASTPAVHASTTGCPLAHPHSPSRSLVALAVAFHHLCLPYHRIPNAGFGAFALRRLAAGEHTEQYKCRHVRAKDINDASRSWGINATHSCDGQSIPQNNPLLYVNSISTEDTCKHQNVKAHSSASIRNDGYVTYVALRAIDVGEELIVSYGHDYFKQVNYTRFECGMSSIAIAAARGDAVRVRDMIADRRREGKNVSSLVNARAHEWTPLHEASNRGHAEAIAALVEGGAIVDQAIQSNGKTSLTIASERGHTGAVKVLLAAGASDDRARQDGETALMGACHGGHRDVAELLLDQGTDVGQAKHGGWTALMLACRNGHRDVCELLLDRGADVGQVDEDGMTALMLACQDGHRDVGELLLDRGAVVGQADEDGWTALMWACRMGHHEVAVLLLDRGADVEQAKHDGWTALMLACRNGHRDVSELLLDRGSVVGQADKYGWTALMLACQDGHRDVAELLLDRGADVGQANNDGTTALMLARLAERGDVVELLLSRGNQRSPPRAADELPDHAELGRLASSRRIAVRTST